MYYGDGGNYNNNGVGDPSLYMQQYDEQFQQQESEFDRTEEEIDEEMQRELAEDAPWKKIQQNTFTRWANEHLKLVNKRIDDLQNDFSDGLNLIALIEVLSHKKLPRHNKKPQFRSQKLENVSVALDFLENVEHIRLVNIGRERENYLIAVLSSFDR
jgi:filamin